MSFQKWTIVFVMALFAMATVVACGESTAESPNEEGGALSAEVGADDGAEKECRGPNPAGCTQEGCDRGEKCVVDPDVCAPSVCSCNNGTWVCTKDCGGGGVCEPSEPVCTTPNPAGCTQDGCDVGEECVVDPDTCEPTSCFCGGGDSWACTRDCGGGGVCEPYDPCRDKVCGESCQVCPPNDPDCVETTEIKACNTDGQCVSDTGDLCEDYDPCDGKLCGESCQVCPPNDPTCIAPAVVTGCNGNGQCVPDTGELCSDYDPCLGLS